MFNKDFLLGYGAGKAAGGGGGGSGGYDLVIKLDTWDVPNLTDADLHLVSGSYAAAIAKVTAGQPITAYVYAAEADDPYYYFNAIPIYSMYADAGYHDAIEIEVLPRELRADVRNSAGSGQTIIYNATTKDPRKIYITESGISFTAPWD